ncbi:MAG: hypothetical protein HQ514_15320 [Rhodospirillales bacterium]|nr:hypothetical protein [Rhodospirillales bacterium]
MTGPNIHIVGSVPLADAETVFGTIGRTLGSKVLRIPDGETGDRLDWISWLAGLFDAHPDFERVERDFLVHAQATAMPSFRLKPGASAATLEFGPLGYAANAARSHEIFARLKIAGAIPAHCRFQIDLVPAHTIIRTFVHEDDQEAVEPAYDAALRREIDAVAKIAPHDQLAIQFDVASAVFYRLEKGEATRYGATKADMLDSFSREMIGLGDCVPGGVDLIYHLCYGDNKHRHSIEPTDTADMTAFANLISRGISRPIQLFHMPVPRDRSDDDYFAPLTDLALRPETRVSLGLVHHTDGVAGTRRRMATAEKFLPEFLIATECGFGRRAPETIPELLRIHAEIAGI